MNGSAEPSIAETPSFWIRASYTILEAVNVLGFCFGAFQVIGAGMVAANNEREGVPLLLISLTSLILFPLGYWHSRKGGKGHTRRHLWLAGLYPLSWFIGVALVFVYLANG